MLRGAGGERVLFYSSTSGNWLISKVSQVSWGNTGQEALAGRQHCSWPAVVE
jgi:hypothetical protein